MGTSVDRRRVMAGDTLPYDYEVEYLGHNNTKPYIDTNIRCSDIDEFVIKCSFNPIAVWVRICGDNGGINTIFTAGIDYSSAQVSLNSALIQCPHAVDFRTPHEYKVKRVQDKIQLYMDGVLKTEATATQAASQSIFHLFNKGAATNVNVYSAELLSNGQSLCNLISVVANGVGCMYDKVSGQLLHTPVGSFTVGPVKS